MTHFVGNQAANGVELVVWIRTGQCDGEGVVDPLYGRVTTDPVGVIG